MEISQMVTGKLDCSFVNFVNRCEIALKDEQAKPLPDNSLIAILCDAIRIVQEHLDYVEGSIK